MIRHNALFGSLTALLLRTALCVGLCRFLGLFTGCKPVDVAQSNQISPEAALDQFYKNDGPEDIFEPTRYGKFIRLMNPWLGELVRCVMRARVLLIG